MSLRAFGFPNDLAAARNGKRPIPGASPYEHVGWKNALGLLAASTTMV